MGSALMWCPSDTGIKGLRFVETGTSLDGTPIGTAFTSYRGIVGTFMYFPNQLRDLERRDRDISRRRAGPGGSTAGPPRPRWLLPA